MKKIYIFSLIGVLFFALGGTALAVIIPGSEHASDKAKAPEKSSVIEETDSGLWDLERVDFIHHAKPVGNPAKPNKPSASTCYSLMGVKWLNKPVSYVINPTNSFGLSEAFVGSAISSSAEAWDIVTTEELFNDAYSLDYQAQYGVQNFENAIVFGNYSQTNVIGVTSVWFTRKGKQIVEFDMLLNTDYLWGNASMNTSTSPAVMDLQNIVTHELGHAVGLEDLYSSACSEVSMYGYSDYNETSKRTLELPDIQGLRAIYGM